MRLLDDFTFADGSPVPKPNFTRVVAEVLKPPATPVVYLASEIGFRNYCEGCAELAMVQETEFNDYPLRVFCSVGRCSK